MKKPITVQRQERIRTRICQDCGEKMPITRYANFTQCEKCLRNFDDF